MAAPRRIHDPYAQDPHWYLITEQERAWQAVLDHAQDHHPDDALGAVHGLIGSSPAWYIHHLLRIQDESSQLIRFDRWNAGQVRMYMDQVVPGWYGGDAVEAYVLKPRRIGSSAFWAAIDYWRIGTRPLSSGIVLAHKREIAQLLFRVVSRYHRQLPRGWRHDTMGDSRTALIFQNKAGTGLDSHLYTGTAGVSAESADAMGRGDTLRLGHFSEVDFYAHPEELLSGFRPSLKREHGTFLVLESSPNMMGGFGDSTWQACEEGRSRLRHVYLSWMDVPWRATGSGWARKYSSDLPCTPREYEGTITSEESDLIEVHGLSLEQIEWWRQVLDDARGSREKRRKEYPISAEDAFLSTGSNVFDPHALRLHGEVASMVPPIVTGVLREDGDDILVSPLPPEDSVLWVYRPPHPEHTYVVGGDVGHGYENGDLTSFAVLDRVTSEFVAHWDGRWKPEDAALQMALLGWLYGTALLVPERSGPGHSLIDALHRRIGYPWIYEEIDPSKRRLRPGQRQDRRMGRATTPQSRPILIDDLKLAIDGGEVLVYHQFLLSEARGFVVKDGKEQAGPGKTDDRLIGMALALRGHKEHAQQDRTIRAMREKAEKKAVRKALESLRGARMGDVAIPGAMR